MHLPGALLVCRLLKLVLFLLVSRPLGSALEAFALASAVGMTLYSACCFFAHAFLFGHVGISSLARYK